MITENITVGTGIGMGVLCGGRLIHGMQHPELGHMPVAPVFGDQYQGCCPYHGRCLEGMASGTAMRGRWERRRTERTPPWPSGLKLCFTRHGGSRQLQGNLWLFSFCFYREKTKRLP